MSRSSKACRFQHWTIIATVLAVGSSASAEMQEKDKITAKTKPTPVESMARIPDSAPRSSLKCWQEGRLIFESNGVSMAGSGSGVGTAPAFKGSNGRTLQLLDMHHGLCILEYNNG